MSSFVIALLLAVSGGTWAYTKVNRSTGGNTGTSVMMGGLAGLIIFVISLILLSFIPS